MIPVDYQKLFRQLPDAFMLLTPEAIIVDNSDAHVAVSLKKREEVLGRSMFEAFPSVDQNQGDIIFQSQEHVRQHREPHAMPVIRYDLQVPAERGGGFEPMYWQATHFPILDARGELLYILQKTENITEKYLAEQRNEQMQRELAENQNRTEFILQSLPALIWTARPDGYRDFFNQRWLAFTGKALEDLTGSQWLADIHPDDVARTQSTWQESVKQGTVYQVEYRLRRADGQYRWVLVRGLPRHDADGQITMWVGCGFDIQDQKQMVQELLEANEQQADMAEQAYHAQKQAQSQRETFYNLFQQAPALICILRGPEHTFDFVNPQYQQLFPHRQLVGLPVTEALPEVVEQGFIGLLDKVYQTGETFHGNEIRIMLDRDGSGQLQPSYLNFTYQLFREGDQKAGITVFAYEITDLVEARQALENLRDQGTAPSQ
ncbi:PAS domain S-box-containing protein [Hymenobacter daecheongensis DSM 21074]|uniref:histidine kinase n=1 Tax=Hymenobacter daecheongensis DSM 21074 TaxID=1121955 RepID=A0A1M6KV06_9BACT|nr:PAS domain S-box protein [Hymenobacter daecheongensis]SHJ62759.1 PAS domain S-box-containing protein [Hymenobacter daecheongensis DSM 21074]